MSSKHSRYTPSPSSPVSGQSSKLSKFLQRQSSRDRSRSTTDPAASTPGAPAKSARKGSKFLTNREKDEKSPARGSLSDTAAYSTNSFPPPVASTNFSESESVDDPPVIIEPVVPRPRTRSERPLSSVSDVHPSLSLYSSTSTARISELPTRLSGWFSHTFSTSTSDLSLPNLFSQNSHLSAASPRSKGSALLAAAKQGKGHIDKAVRYIFDSDSTPDKCTDPIWLLGVQHPGYEPPPAPMPATLTSRRSSADIRKFGSSASFRSSASSRSSPSPPADQSLLLSQSQPSLSRHPGNNWPTSFYTDFSSRIWLTYRSQFQPIRDTTLISLDSDSSDNTAPLSSSPILRRWNWGGEKGWSSDQGWGCMLRTGQSLLANALLHLHLGRDWRRPPCPLYTADYALYVQIITWFLDSPLPLAPFSVHRMALAGKELGKDVGQWFGPSTAAGAIKRLVREFPEAGLGIAVAADSAVFQSDVYAASQVLDDSSQNQAPVTWGGRAVLVLIGVRLGIDGVNPIYYETIKALYSFPQSVGIAGGRPSSSYYFVGSQAGDLFYLDPHHTRPTIPLRLPPLTKWGREGTPESDREKGNKERAAVDLRRSSSSNHHRIGTYSSSIRTGSSTFSYHGPMSPSPLQQQLSTSSASTDSSVSPSASSSQRQLAQSPVPVSISKHMPTGSPVVSSDVDHREFGIEIGGGSGSGALDVSQDHYARAYSPVELKTFHCDRVRKMPLSGLDPSMLIGFLCKDEDDWFDFKQRVTELSQNHKTIFSVQDEPPSWPSDCDDNMGLESLSEPDDLDLDMDEPEEDGDAERFLDRHSRSLSTSSGGHDQKRNKSEEIVAKEDTVDPITSGPDTRTFDDVEHDSADADIDKDKGVKEEVFSEGNSVEVEDDWVDPSMPIPPVQPPPSPPPTSPIPSPASIDLTQGKTPGKKGKRGKKKQAVCAVRISTPPAEQEQQHFPFPVTQKSTDDAPPLPSEERRHLSALKGKRMHTAKARDGGRTQSGGVKGVLPTDDC